jgi:uncharacterized membrane protein YfcA
VIQKYSKGIISLLVFAFAAIALFAGGSIFGFHVTGDFQAKVIALIPLGAGVVAVIGIKNATEDAIDKAIMQFVTGAIAVAQFFAQIPSDLGVKIGAFLYAAVAAYFVWRKANTPEPAPAAVASGIAGSSPPVR